MLQIIKARIHAGEFEFDGAGGAVSVLGNNNFRDTFFGRFFVVVIVTIDKGDDVGVLLDRAGFA